MEAIQEAISFSNDSRKLNLECEHCGQPFTPRSGTGGKPQRFCSAECRAASHNKPQRSQRSPTCSNGVQLPAVTQPAEKDAPQAAPAGDFDWSDTDSVVLPEQPATACYFNPCGELVIRQKRWPDDDSFIYIAPNLISEFIDKLTGIIGVPSVGRRS